MPQRDTIYQHPVDAITSFTFDDKVASVFPDMIQRSVPGYSTIIAMTGVLAGRFAQANSQLYDLGCSLGASTLSMSQQITQPGCRIIAIDNSPAMIERCHQVMEISHNDKPEPVIDLKTMNIEEADITNASVVVMNFTLQFISPEKRADLLQTIFNGMLSGGILVLSEKICFSDSHLETLNTELHHEFKKRNGYSDLEISQKRTALENVLQPETLDRHQQRLTDAGFTSIDVWFQCFNFASMVAIKS
jgi:tRNA (cmo5U34)-methyltransferase